MSPETAETRTSSLIKMNEEESPRINYKFSKFSANSTSESSDENSSNLNAKDSNPDSAIRNQEPPMNSNYPSPLSIYSTPPRATPPKVTHPANSFSRKASLTILMPSGGNIKRTQSPNLNGSDNGSVLDYYAEENTPSSIQSVGKRNSNAWL